MIGCAAAQEVLVAERLLAGVQTVLGHVPAGSRLEIVILQGSDKVGCETAHTPFPLTHQGIASVLVEGKCSCTAANDPNQQHAKPNVGDVQGSNAQAWSVIQVIHVIQEPDFACGKGSLAPHVAQGRESVLMEFVLHL